MIGPIIAFAFIALVAIAVRNAILEVRKTPAQKQREKEEIDEVRDTYGW